MMVVVKGAATRGKKRQPSKYCHKCGYILEHTTSHTCPECGRGFDPNDPSTYAVWQSDLSTHGHEPIWGALVGGVFGSVLSFVLWGLPAGICFSVGLGVCGFACGYAFRKDRM